MILGREFSECAVVRHLLDLLSTKVQQQCFDTVDENNSAYMREKVYTLLWMRSIGHYCG